MAFKGVFLEGTEVVLIVVSLGAAQHRLGLAALAAAAAAVLVAIVGLLVARQLSEVPENTIKTVVGVMLTSFGVFWVGEGAGVHWPGSDLAIPVLVGFFVVVFFAFTAFMRTQLPRRPVRHSRPPREGDAVTAVARAIRAFGHFWWDFLVGDTPELALATGAIVGLAFLLAGQRWVGAILLPLVAAAFLFVSTYRGRRRAPRNSVAAVPVRSSRRRSVRSGPSVRAMRRWCCAVMRVVVAPCRSQRPPLDHATIPSRNVAWIGTPRCGRRTE